MKYSIAVRSLCEFTAKVGDLDLRFTPTPTGREGVEGHAAIARRRGPGYETEVALESDYDQLRVRGRADGYDAAANRLEEFKTHRGDLRRMPDSHRAVHWAQLRIYGALFCRHRGLGQLHLALVYFDIATETETVLTELQSADALERHFADHCDRFLEWARAELEHRIARDTGLKALSFPFGALSGRQRELAEAVYKGVCRQRVLLAQAPTGIGKTIGTLFPALKAMPGARLDKIFFLVPKTSGRRIALDALAEVQRGAERPALRILELVARDTACEHPDLECHGASCPLAGGFYDRLPEARRTAMKVPLLDRATVRAIGLEHGVCPYYLGQELARWADVIVGDYNYYFDLTAALHALTTANQWRVAVLIDEAHNLVERARAMYSAELDRRVLAAARRKAPLLVKRSLAKVVQQWNALVAEQAVPYRVLESVPERFVRCLEASIASIAELSSEQPAGVPPALLDFYFQAIRFCRLAADFDRDMICDLTTGEGTDRACAASATLCLRNVIPKRFLSARWATAHSSVLFSATIEPFRFYRDVLGLPGETQLIDVGSPFRPEQLRVRIVRSISTRFRHRARSIQPIAELIAAQYRVQPGNYLAFFSSFHYLRAVAGQLAGAASWIPLWCQETAMSEDRRDEFLARFEPHGSGIGFAVLGGAFGEAIDLPGKRLIGAFVATLGLPQLNPVNDETQRRIDERFGAGYEYTYLYPGLRKVVQAAGRVIRTREDRGVVYLIDDRFGRPEIRSLLPRWWNLDELPAPPVPCT